MAVTIDGAGEINGVVLPTTSFGKILQIVRATDSTNRATTSTSYVDVTGMSVTITPQKSTSAILLIATGQVYVTSTTAVQTFGNSQITDSSNSQISGAQDMTMGSESQEDSYSPITLIGYATPATTSPVTYKTRFKANSGVTVTYYNALATGQMYAIEVSA